MTVTIEATETTEETNTALLQVKNLSVSFHSRDGVTRAVNNVSFDLHRGQTLCIVGESGSGKSVTCYSLLGLLPTPPASIDQGEAWYQGQDLLKLSKQQMHKIRGGNIAMIFQDPMTSLNPYLSIGSQLIETLQLHQPQSWHQARHKAQQILQEVGIDDAGPKLKYYPHEFSGGMRQRVMIAMALIAEPEILIADEPTTALDVTIQAQILDLIASLQVEKNLAVIFITHDLAVAEKISSQVLVMQQGHIVERGAPTSIFNQPQQDYTQALVNAIPSSAKAPELNFSQPEIMLNVEQLSVHFRISQGFMRAQKSFCAVDQISLQLKKGEIFGIVGESGSGKTTLGKAIMRLVTMSAGVVTLDGEEISALQGLNLEQSRANFQMIFQDPYASLNPRMTVFDTLSEPLRLLAKTDNSQGYDNPQQQAQAVIELLEDVGLGAQDMLKYPHEFSGGQRQRIAIARALALKPKLIIADEPVSALDVTIQAQVLDLLIKLVKRHQLTMVFISHDMGVIRYLCDRVAVMKAGQIVEFGITEDIFNDPQQGYTQDLLAAIV